MHLLKSDLRRKLFFSYIFLVIAVIFIYSFTFYFLNTRSIPGNFQYHKQGLVNTLALAVSSAVSNNDKTTFLKYADAYVQDGSFLSITVMDLSGNIWADTNKKATRISMDQFHEDVVSNQQIATRKILLKGEPILEIVVPVLDHGKAMYLLNSNISLLPVKQMVAKEIQSIISISFGFFIFGFIVAFIFSKRFSEPQNLLFQTVNKISKDHLPHKITKNPDYGLNAIGETLYKVVSDLQKLSEEKKNSERMLLETRNEMEARIKERTIELIKEVEDRILVEKKYRKIMDASPVPITVFNMDGKPIYTNPAFTHTFGWTLQEFQLEKTNYIPDEEQELNIQIRKKIIKGESGHGIETRRYNRQGNLLDVNISFDVWRGKDNTPIGCVVILHDVTQSKQLETQLFQAQKMEAMGTLAGGIAHDFNNILSGIFGFSQLAAKHAGDAKKAKGHINQIVKGAQRAAGLVQQILTFCRQTEYKKQYFDLEPVLKEALSLLYSSIPPTIEIEEKIGSNICIVADSTQIHQVIMNLCTNACHAMIETGGKLKIRLNKISVSGEEGIGSLNVKPGNYALLEIDDTGHGMDKETLEKAFDPYFTTKENGKGTGFGLALVKAIVESHDGYIMVSSTPEKGSHFEVYLPSEKQKIEKESTSDEEPVIVGGTEKIMVVDDEESIRMAVKEFLEDYGYKVSTFNDGKQALEAFKKESDYYDLIFTDMTMPKMAGDTLAKEILNIREDMPVILSTGYSEKISEEKALEVGVKFFIQKPVSNQKLEQTIRKALDKEMRIITISTSS